MKRLTSYITEKKTASELTLKKMLVNLKCLGKFGKSIQGFSRVDREAAIDTLIEWGWIDDKMQITPAGDEVVKANLELCQESKKNFLAECPTDVGLDDLSEFNKLVKDLELDTVIQVWYGGETIIVRVPEEAAPDDDYAVAYIEALKEKATKWKFGKIKRLM